MKGIINIVFLLLSAAAFSQNATHVVVLGFDGMSPNGIKNANTPNFDELIKNGSHTFHAHAVMPTSSSSNWASMIMGAPPEKHGIFTNKWDRIDGRKQTFCGRRKGRIWPTVFGVIRDQRKHLKIACFHDWVRFGRLTDRYAFNRLESSINEMRTARRAAHYIKRKKPDFLFLHFDHVDHAGHMLGHGTPEYFKAVEVADSLAGVIINALKQAGIFENTIILVTADHGGIGKGHGGPTLEEVEIPWIISGPGIKKGFEITEPVETFYTAPTLTKIVGVTPPDCWTGKPVLSAFE